MSRTTRKPRQQGFTLIEVLVAFAILALFLGAFMPTLSTSMSASRTGGYTITAAAYAQSLIAGVGVSARLAEGEFTNTLEQPRFSSRLVVRPYGGLAVRDEGPRLFEVIAHVSWRDGARARTVSLGTFRFAKGR